MEQLLTEIEAYAEARGIKPATVLQYAANLSGLTWKHWQGGGHCSVPIADKIRAYMASNPVTPDASCLNSKHADSRMESQGGDTQDPGAAV